MGRVSRCALSLASYSADEHQGFVSGDTLTGREVVLSGFFAARGVAAHHQVTAEMKDRAEDALRLAQAEPLAGKPMAQMSTGEARRVLIARALAPDPQALLLDEPTTGLDLSARRRFLQTLRGIASAGKTIILVTHHAEEIFPEIGRTVLLRYGKSVSRRSHRRRADFRQSFGAVRRAGGSAPPKRRLRGRVFFMNGVLSN